MAVAPRSYPSEKIQAYLAKGGHKDLGQIDFFKASSASTGDAELSAQAVQTYSRLYKLTFNHDDSQKLLAQGIASAAQVAVQPERSFVNGAAAAAGIDSKQARSLHQQATRIHNRTMQLFAAAQGAVASPHFRSMRAVEVGDQVTKHFEDLPSYQELFGSLNFCGCDECKSIFGPAAYFVDLMRIIDLYVTQPNKATIVAQDEAFLLSKRRPDLWTLPLTCEMTNNTLAYLQVVNERLTDAVKTAYTTDKNNPLTTDALIQQMATSFKYPLNLPFNFPLDRVRVLSRQIDVALSDLYAAWGVGADLVVRERLGLSPDQLDILTKAATDPKVIAAFYGDRGLDDLKRISCFREQTGLTVTGLIALIEQNLSPDEIAAKVPANLFINQGLGDAFLTLAAVGNETSTIGNLNNVALDQINRLRRLAAAPEWSAETTDWCLRAVKNGAAPAIDAAALAGFDRIARFAAAFDVTPIQASVLFGPIKTYGGDGTDPISPFDGMFNDPAVVSAAPYRPKDAVGGSPYGLNATYQNDPLAWTPRATTANAADVAAISRVIPGLGLSLSAANGLGVALFGASQQWLNVDTLSALHRHALLSRLFGLTLDDYLTLLALQGSTPKVFAGPDLDALVERWRWMNDVNLDVPTLDYVMRGTPSVYVDPLYDPSAVKTWLQGLPSLVDAKNPAESLTRQIAVFFNTSVELASPCLALAVQAALSKGADWTQAFLGQDPKAALPVLGAMSRWLVLAQQINLSPALLANVTAYPASYGLAPTITTLSWDVIQGVQRFAAVGRRFGDRRGDLLRYVALSQPDNKIDPNDPSTNPLIALQSATGWNPAAVSLLLAVEVQSATTAPERIRRLAVCFDQMAAFGADVSFMRGLAALATPKGWTDYVTQAGLCQAKVSGRYGEKTWRQIGARVEGKLQVRLRDALVGLELAALHKLYPDIATPNNVYEFLLTDVETGPEAQISYLKESLNAVQLYLQRCRLRLEPGVEILDVPPAYWDWIMNYRVWEANRRIFLYPENYLQPSLRRDQTSLFKALDSDLRQSEITSDYVESIYTRYIDGFTETARLKPVEAYRCTADDPKRGKIKTLFLLARTETAPYTFYICSQPEAAVWSEWQKIELTINSPHVTPIYAFGRLFLFWVEVKSESSPNIQVGANSGQTNNNRVYRATIQYSFVNHQGAWVSAQTLAKDVVVLFQGQGTDAVKTADNPLFTDSFDLDALPWRKILAFHVRGANWPGGNGPISDSDRIVVSFGPYLHDITGKTKPDAQTGGTDATTFMALLGQRITEHNLTITGRLSGELALNGHWALDSNLLSNYVGHNAELLLIDPYLPKVPLNQFTPNLDDLNLQLQLVRTSRPITANYLADIPGFVTAPAQPAQVNAGSFASAVIPIDLAIGGKIFNALVTAQVVNVGGIIASDKLATVDLAIALGALLADGTITAGQLPAIMDVLLQNLGNVALFSTVNPSNARVVTVKNQPGWFLFNNGDETFLLQPQGQAQTTVVFSAIDDGLLVSQPPLNANSFVIPGTTPLIGSDTSAQVFSLLQTYTAIDGRGLCQPNVLTGLGGIGNVVANLISQNKLSQDQLPMLTGILLNYPQVFDDTFVGGRIDTTKSALIFGLLQQYAMIDHDNRLHVDMLSSTSVAQILANQVMTGTLAQKDLPTIYRALVRAPIAYAFSYWNQGDTSNFATLANGKFIVTRLTTAAVQPLSRALFAGGIDRLLRLDSQNIPVAPVLPFSRLGPSNANIIWPSAIDGAQVDYDGLYGRYFWELFFHGPMLVANALAGNLQFRDALAWFHYVFNPTVLEHPVTDKTFSDESGQAISPDASKEAFGALQKTKIGDPPKPILDGGMVNPLLTPSTDLGLSAVAFTADQVAMIRNILLNYQLASRASRFWQFRPFRNQTLETLRESLTDGSDAMLAYEDDPFNPFAIARLRIGAFEKATVMQYIDTLIQWGDFYFTQDTWESIVAATMLYVYASDLLGPRPEQIGICATPKPATFADIVAHYDKTPIPEFLIDLETRVPAITATAGDAVPAGVHAFNDLGTYFCVPENDVFIGYWDRVEDRLNKIRASENIKGQFRLLALFEPPIDPLALIRAAGSSSNVLGGAPGGQNVVPPYRFTAALERARRFAATASQLGTALQAALEVKDGEALALLRNTHEAHILAATVQMKQGQITRTKANIAALQATQLNSKTQLDHYTKLLDDGLSASEQLNLSASETALMFTLLASILKTASSIGYAVPQVGSPFAMTYGGQQLGAVIEGAAGAAQIGSDVSTFAAQRALTMAGYQRRTSDWTLGKTVAQNEYDSLTQQIAASHADLAVAQQDLVVLQKTIAQNQDIDDFLRRKFTNADLYQWMAGRISTVYFQSYQIAFQAALAAQQAYQYEADSTQTFINFDYWDGGRRGLRAAEGLSVALDMMEAAYAGGNTRRLEIERTISLAALNPIALASLKTSGTCTFDLPEMLFDYDYPGHYARKIQSLSLSIPAVVGPYQNIKAFLQQTKSAVAVSNSFDNVRFLLGDLKKQPATVISDMSASNRQIAVSRGIDDNGLFVLDFRDERYLPFEGTGAVSSWTLDMPRETNPFDFAQLSDVVITLRYTALYDGELRKNVEPLLGQKYPLAVGYYLPVQQAFSLQWQAFMSDHTSADTQTLQFNYTPGWLGYLREMSLKDCNLQLEVDLGMDLKKIAPVTIGTLQWGKSAPQDLKLENGLISLKIPGWTREPMGGPWQIVFDLKAIRQSKDLTLLLSDDGWFNAAKLLNVELLLDCQVKLFGDGSSDTN